MPRALACAFVRTPGFEPAARSPETDRQEKEEKRKEGGGRIKEIQTYSEKLPDHRRGGGSASGPGWYTLVKGRAPTLMTRFRLAVSCSKSHPSSLVINRPLMLNVAIRSNASSSIYREKRNSSYPSLRLLSACHDEIAETMISNAKYMSGILFRRASENRSSTYMSNLNGQRVDNEVPLKLVIRACNDVFTRQLATRFVNHV